ncbi:MAG: hypothetical protein QXH07_06810 [Thermoplasmata archaeon]
MSNYSNGANRERRIMHKLEKEGWSCFRMAGSHTPIDIIAIRNVAGKKEMLFIQSKKTHYLTPQQQKQKKEMEDKLGIAIEVW